MGVCYAYIMKPSDRARVILSRIEYATLATVDEKGHPWNAPVYTAYDAEYNFYWGSYKDSQHSRNILLNNKAFLTVYDSTATPGTGEGVYIKASCSEITNPEEFKRVHALIQKRRDPIPYWKLEKIQTPDSPIRLYQAVPEMIWMNGDSTINNIYVDIRVDAES